MVSGLMETPPVLSPVISGPAGIRFGVCLQTRYFGLWGGGPLAAKESVLSKWLAIAASRRCTLEI